MIIQNTKKVKRNMAESEGYDPYLDVNRDDKFIGLSPNLWDSLSNHRQDINKDLYIKQEGWSV